MKEWVLQKITEYTSRKFIGFLIIEILIFYNITSGRITDSWACIAGIIVPFILYIFINGTIELEDIKYSGNGIEIGKK